MESLIAGPPVEKENSFCPSTSLPARLLSPDFKRKVHCTPAGRSLSKSKTQFLPSAHLPVPFSGQSISKGSIKPRGSPHGTICAEKRTVTCRTPFTVPCGETISTDGLSSAKTNGITERKKTKTSPTVLSFIAPSLL